VHGRGITGPKGAWGGREVAGNLETQYFWAKHKKAGESQEKGGVKEVTEERGIILKVVYRMPRSVVRSGGGRV